jgi:aminopeptidase N
VRLEVETPVEMTVVSDGRLLTQGPGRTVWEAEHPVRGLALAAGAYRRHDGRAGPVAVYAFFYPQTSDLSGTYLTAATGYLTLYQELFGPYPFEKFAVVENFFPTGYGFPSWTLLGSSVIRLPFIVSTSLGHEVAHCWWGNGVWVDYTGGNWSEGLTTYVADYLYKERQSPAEAKEYRLKILRDYAALVSPGREIALREFTGRTTAASQAVGYGKAAMVFHMARRQVGEEAFWGGLRRVAEEKLFRPAAWSDFAAAFSRAGDIPMDAFFRQWIERPGAPVLSLAEVRQVRSGAGWEVSGTIRQTAPFYTLKIPVRLETAAGTEEIVLVSNQAAAPFRLQSASEPRRLVVDPEADLFRRLDDAEIPPTVNGVRGSESLLVIAADHFPPELLDAARLLLAGMGKRNLPIVPESRIAPSDLRGRDLLFLAAHAPGAAAPLPLRAGGHSRGIYASRNPLRPGE